MLSPHATMFADASERTEHFRNHGADFGAITEYEYEALACRFLAKSPCPQFHECSRNLGDFVRFDMTTNEFAVVSKNGFIRTYYKPKFCLSLPKGVRKIKCHRFPTHLDYAIFTCSKF